jgi:Domain of Unknown Function (DUF1080)
MRRYLRLVPLFALGLVLALLPAARSADKEVPEGFESLFTGKDLSGWQVNKGGNMDRWGAEDGILFTKGSGGGWLLTEKEYGDFELRLEFRVPEKGNSGVALRSPTEGDPAYVGMEIQILDDANYKGLRPTQYTGSIYDVVAPSKQVTKPAGEWQKMRITAKGRRVTVELNGTVTVDANLDDYKDSFEKHKGLLRDKGHVGFQSHDGRVEFRNIYLKTL